VAPGGDFQWRLTGAGTGRGGGWSNEWRIFQAEHTSRLTQADVEEKLSSLMMKYHLDQFSQH
jgi:hypothetical protein